MEKMEKFGKYYLKGEIWVGGAILLSGFFDPSFLFFGLILGGGTLSILGLIIFYLWYLMCRRAGKDVVQAKHGMKINLAVLGFIVLFIASAFSGGIGFMM